MRWVTRRGNGKITKFTRLALLAKSPLFRFSASWKNKNSNFAGVKWWGMGGQEQQGERVRVDVVVDVGVGVGVAVEAARSGSVAGAAVEVGGDGEESGEEGSGEEGSREDGSEAEPALVGEDVYAVQARSPSRTLSKNPTPTTTTSPTLTPNARP